MEHFRKGETLSAERLNELVQGLEAVEVPAANAPARRSGRSAYGPANYNTAELVERGWPDEVEWADYTGLVGAVNFARNLTSSVIRSGEVLLPLAQTTWQHDTDAAATPGLAYAVEFDAVEKPCIKQGVVVVPYADFEGCDGVAVPGVMKGVQVDVAATEPRIDEGVLVLPPSGAEVPLADSAAGVVGRVGSVEYGSTTGKPQIRQGRIQIPVAHYDGCIGAVGVISGIKMDYGTEPQICNGIISLPFVPKGLLDDCGGLVTWNELRNGLRVIKTGEASHFGFSAQVLSNGALDLYINRE